MFENIGQFVVRHRKGVFVGYLISVLVAGVIGAGMFGSLKSQGYDDLGSDSAAVDQLLKSDFDTRDASVILVIDTLASIDDPQSVTAANDLLAKVAEEENIESIVSYWNSGQESLKSFDGNAGLALVYFTKGLDSEQAAATAKNIQDTYDKESAGTRAYVGGIEVLYEAINGQIRDDLKIAEAIAIPLNVLMLLFVFGAAVAAGLPMVVALGSIAGSFFVLFLVTQFTDV